MRYLGFKRTLATSVVLLASAVQPANAVDPNNPSRIPEKVMNFSCVSGGWNIEVKQYDTGQDSVHFSGVNIITETLRALPTGWAPDPYFPPGIDQATFFPEIVQDVTKPHNGRVCDTSDGSIIGYGSSYVVLKRNNDEDWQYTQIDWEGEADNLVGLSAGQVLKKFRHSLATQPNAGPLPPSNMCASANPICFSGSAPTLNRGPDAFDILDMDLWAMDADVLTYLRDDNWGEHLEDLNGLTVTWAKALNSLGIVNTTEIRDNMRPTYFDDGKFIFRKLESSAPVGLTLVEDVDVPLVLRDESGGYTFVYPSKTTNPAGTSWPTSNHVDQLQPARLGMPGPGYPNPNYCAENDPSNPAYIPQYISDPNVLLELGSDLKYLTDAQTSRIESKGWKITDAMKDWTDEDFQNSIPENPTMRRATYDCEMPDRIEAGSSQTRSAFTGEDSVDNVAGINCKIKDVAYYDGLIDRLIVVNPAIGSLNNHPCKKARNLSNTLSNGLALPAQKKPALRAPVGVRAPVRSERIKAAPLKSRKVPSEPE